MKHVKPSAEVAQALARGKPVVALESTIITHGMPSPHNIETARNVEADIREAGAIPATIAVIDGVLHVGMEPDELSELSKAKNVEKLSRADLAVCIAAGGTGSTTVAATMIAAHHAGIQVFATGGIGGVHKGASQSFDVSADLQELSQTPVTVVCAGAKAILDIPATLEVLETLGVPVVTYQQDILPAFWSAKSTLSSPLRMDSPAEIAAAHEMRKALGLPGGQLIANPIPEHSEIPFDVLEPLIKQAQTEADAQNVTGKAVTPVLLQRLYELTEGRSLTANISLVRNNARLAAEIAKKLCASRD